MRTKRTGKMLTAIVLSFAILLSFTPESADAAVRTGVKGTWMPSGIDGVMTYVLPDGTYLTDGYTADGFYVNLTYNSLAYSEGFISWFLKSYAHVITELISGVKPSEIGLVS